MVMQSSLSIVQVQEEDQGEYICAATNPAGEDRASAMLIIFGEKLKSTLQHFIIGCNGTVRICGSPM